MYLLENCLYNISRKMRLINKVKMQWMIGKWEKPNMATKNNNSKQDLFNIASRYSQILVIINQVVSTTEIITINKFYSIFLKWNPRNPNCTSPIKIPITNLTSIQLKYIQFSIT